MKVTMLGLSGSGKTSYMAGLYEVLGANSLEGFKIRPTSLVPDGDWIAESGKFEKISFGARNFDYPPGTKKTTVWSFDLLYESSFVTSISWIDYRGGVLKVQPDDAPEDPEILESLREIATHISISNAVIIFVDSVSLTSYKNLKEASFKSGVNRLVNVLSRFDQQFPFRPLTYVIALSKADAVDKKWQEDNFGKLVSLAQDTFKELIDLHKRNVSHWTGAIIPVSAVGLGNAENHIRLPKHLQDSLEMSSKLISFPEPLNVAHALAFCICQTLRRSRDVAQQTLSDQRDQIEKLLKASNWAKNLWSALTGKQTSQEIASEIYKQQQSTFASLQQFERFIEPLCRMAESEIRIIRV